jgi:hypothetical protein
MNNAGLESSIYDQLRSYSEALNHYLVRLKTEQPTTAFTPPAEVAELIRGLGDSNPIDVSVQLLSSGMKERGAFPDSTVRRLRLALDAARRDSETLTDLERLAQFLGRQQAGAFARLRRMR